jgi:drug/metabolite transporter (DMT)-like permease
MVTGIALAMSGVGLFVITAGGLSGDLGGMLLALGGAVAVTVYLIGGRRLRQRLSLLVYVFYVYAFASAMLLAASLVAGARLTGLPVADYAIFVALGIVPSHLGHTLYNYLLRYLEASVIAVSTLGEPIISSALALFFLGEVPSPWILVGGPMVLVGIYLTVKGSNRKLGFSPSETACRLTGECE